MLKDTFLHQEIFQQPEILRTILATEKANIQKLVIDIQNRKIEYVMIAARGTSDNAARYANYLFGAINHLPGALATPSLFTIYHKPPRLGNALVIGISQSGKSPDIVAVLDEARRQGALTAAITNLEDSDLSHAAEHVIALHAGLEKSIAATKTYTGELAAIAAISATLAGDEQLWHSLEALPGQVTNTLALETEVANIVERYRYMRECVVIGRGYNYCTAFELALKLKELTYTIVEPYSSADFFHGPLAILEPGFPVIVIAAQGDMHHELDLFLKTLNEKRAETILIGNDAALLAKARIPLQFNSDVSEPLSPIVAIIPGQLFAMHLAFQRGLDPDKPRSLKKVTETR